MDSKTDKKDNEKTNYIDNDNTKTDNKTNMSNTERKERFKKNCNLFKNFVHSKDNLKSLSEMDIVDLKLFNKINSKNTLIYTGINDDLVKLLTHNYNINNDFNYGKFKELTITKPIDNNTSSESLTKFSEEKIDNTGNIQLWPSEEILSIYCLINQEKFKNKIVIELGSGYSGLCGLIMMSLIPEIKEMMITDGNISSVIALSDNIIANFGKSNHIEKIKSKVLLWEENYLNENNFKYDFVIISDCLFFKKFHLALVKTIKALLNKEGVCIIVSPKRGETMNLFIAKAKEYFEVKQNYDEINFLNELMLSRGNKSTYSSNYIELKNLS